jgi:hypothetical protein
METLRHNWVVDNPGVLTAETVHEFVRGPVAAVPESIAARVGPCRIVIRKCVEGAPEAASRWSAAPELTGIELATEHTAEHDLALELLVCLGQIVWEGAVADERGAWLRLLGEEIEAGVEGEIDEEAVAEKRRLLGSDVLSRSRRRLERYAGAAFAGTLAEYIHSLWHDVTLRTGPDHLPAAWVRRRFELLARLFPPDAGQRLYSDN